MDDPRTSEINPVGGGFSRRGFLIGGLGVGVMAGMSALGLDFWFDSGLASADTTSAIPLPCSVRRPTGRGCPAWATTRRSSAPTTRMARPTPAATAKGTVFLVLGGGGTDGPSNTYGRDATTNMAQAKVISQRNLIYRTSGGTWVKNPTDSIEDAPWSAMTDAADAYGYASFAVDPGRRPGDTTITMTYFHAPQSGGNPSTGNTGFVGATTYTPFEQVVFGHDLDRDRSGGGA